MGPATHPRVPDLELLRLPERERAALADGFVAGLSNLSLDLNAPSRAVLARISGPNWTLEWSLAQWIGDAWGLDKETSRQLAMANVYMLGYMRVADDLADGDESPSALPLAMALHHLWVMQYVRLFGTARPVEDGTGANGFWRYFETDLTRWLSHTLACRQGPSRPFAAYGEAEFAAYAGRGAAIRTSCAAAAILADRESDLAALLGAVENVMLAVVLLDEEFDWSEDLEAGRNNAFVAYCTEGQQVPATREANRLAVLKEIYLGRCGRSYFDLIDRRLALALRSVRSLGCAAFADFIDWYRNEVAACEAWLQQEKQAGLQRLAQDLASKDVRPPAMSGESPCTSPSA